MRAISEDKINSNLNAYQLLDGLRVVNHLCELLIHFSGYVFKSDSGLPLPARFAVHIVFRIILLQFFAISGISTAKWFVNHSKKSSSASSLVLRFYFERLAMIVPFYYMFLIFYFIFLVILNDRTALINFRESLLPNLLFLWNFFCTEKIVSRII